MEDVRLTQFAKAAGCGCKMSSQNIGQFLNIIGDNTPKVNLIAGTEHKEDAAALRINDNQILLSTTDFFTPIVDNPEDFGYIAAANAVSDVYAMGGKPILAISILGWPTDKLPMSVLNRVMKGALELCQDVNMPLGGGHSIENPEPIFGLSVNGIIEHGRVLSNQSARPGDMIFLTKKLGTGILATAMKKAVIKKPDQESLLKSLRTVNSVGYDLAKSDYVHSMTDVTGFGLIGHLMEVCTASGVSANVDFTKLQSICDLSEYIEKSCIPGGLKRNREAFLPDVENVPDGRDEILFDPQTNGGLLLFVDPEGLPYIQETLQAQDIQNIEPIGQIVEKESKLVSIIE